MSKNYYDGMELMLTAAKRLTIKSNKQKDKQIVVWTDVDGNLNAKFENG